MKQIYQSLINKREGTILKHLKDSKAFFKDYIQMIWIIFIKILKETI